MKINGKFLRFMVALSITVGIFVFLLSTIDFSRVMAALQEANISLIIFVFFILIFGNSLLDVCRWKVILHYLHYPISFKEALLIKVAANLLITVLPFRSGELSRLVYLKRLKNIPYTKTTLSIAVEYGHKIFILLLYLCIGMGLYYFENHKQNTGYDFNRFSLTLMPLCFIKLDIYRVIMAKWGEKYLSVFQLHFNELKDLLKNKKIFFFNFLYTSTDFINFYLLSKSLSMDIPVSAILFFLPLILFISCLPFTIAGLGSRELSILFFFQKYASSEVLLSLGILYSLVEFVLPFLVGVLVMAFFFRQNPKFECWP